MACGCGRSPDDCRGWHALEEDEFQLAYKDYLNEKVGKLRVTDVEHYTDTLFKFQLIKPKNFEFKAGQFTMIGLDDTPKRAYSLTSAPQDGFIEFYSIKVPDGALTSKLQHIKVGDFVNVSDKPVGNLVVENLTEGTDLWLLATGTGIAPFISMLCQDYTYEKFKNIHVLWSVRIKEEILAFDEFLKSLPIHYIPIVTRDERWDGETNRISNLIKDGIILKDGTPETDKIMLCGNMEFNIEIRDEMLSRGWVEGSNRENGSFLLEKAFVG